MPNLKVQLAFESIRGNLTAKHALHGGVLGTLPKHMGALPPAGEGVPVLAAPPALAPDPPLLLGPSPSSTACPPQAVPTHANVMAPNANTPRRNPGELNRAILSPLNNAI
jgi:hypothetical protein